jgi:hypothetical protein
MDELQTSENKEAVIVLAGSLSLAATTYVAALPIPAEIKVPTVVLIGTVGASILAFWKKKINVEQAKE